MSRRLVLASASSPPGPRPSHPTPPPPDGRPGEAAAQGPSPGPGRRGAGVEEGDRRGGGSAAGAGGREAGEVKEPEEAEEEEKEPSLGVRAALAALGFYRGVLSPLMPSTCRFLPSCSIYSIESYKKFGVARGTVLTAWRLLRCNPWGGRGYDPPAWPPVGLGAVYSLPYTPEISVVLGAWLGYWFVASTLESLVR